MNVPNQLTLSRLLLTGAFMLVMNFQFPFSRSVALLLFIAAGLTDFFDGHIARRDKLVTNFGILMDPLADKILTCLAFIVFVERRIMPAWMGGLIVARELAITGLRLLAASRNMILAAERYGKHKTISQITCIIAILVELSYPEWGSYAVAFFSFYSWAHCFVVTSIWVAVLLTVVSGTIYLWKNRELYIRDM